MPFAVLLTNDAARDLEELYDYIAVHDAPQKADYVLEQVEKAFSTLSEFPERGAYPKELVLLGIREYARFSSNLTVSFTSHRQEHLRPVDCRWPSRYEKLLQRRLLDA